MTVDAAEILKLADQKTGHFRFESGFHAARWLDLDALFVEPARLRPFVDDLGRQLAAFRVDAICGPLLGGAFVAQLIANVLDCEAYFTRRVTDANGNGLYAARYELPAAFRSRVAG